AALEGPRPILLLALALDLLEEVDVSNLGHRLPRSLDRSADQIETIGGCPGTGEVARGRIDEAAKELGAHALRDASDHRLLDRAPEIDEELLARGRSDSHVRDARDAR